MKDFIYWDKDTYFIYKIICKLIIAKKKKKAYPVFEYVWNIKAIHIFNFEYDISVLFFLTY